MRNKSALLVSLVLMCACWAGLSQELDTNCVVSILNRTARVRPDGTWRIDNVPANMGLVRVRATCVKDGITLSGQSDFINLEPNIANGFSPFALGSATPIPSTLRITTPATTLNGAGATAQLTVIATYPDSSTKNVTAAANGTSYTISSPSTGTISPDGLVTAQASGTVVISAINDGAIGMIQLRVQLSGDSDGDGIADDLEIVNGLNPNNPVDAEEDADLDGLTNKQELQDFGTNMRLADSDSDGILDGEEVVAGQDGFITSALLADTDGDGVRDKLEIQTGSDPTNPASLNLAQALQSLEVTPASFVLTVNTIIGEASRQLAVTGHLKDGTTINLTSTARGTTYNSSDLFVANFGSPDGRVFAGNNGSATITVSNSGFTKTVNVLVQSFAPIARSFVSIPGFANNVDVNGDYAYVAAGSTGLQVVNVANRNAPVVVASRDTPGNANDVRVVGNLAFVADGAAGLQIIDVSNPLAPVIVGSLDTPGTAWDVTVSGNRAYIADGASGLRIIDISNPAVPTLLGSVDTPGTAKGVDVSANLAVVADGSSGIQVIDISNPALPAILGSRSTSGDARDVSINGNFAYVADFSRSFTAVNISNPSNPILGPSTPSSTGGLLQDAVIVGRFAFGADVFFVNGVPIIDVSTPGSPVPRAILNFASFRDDNGTGIAVDNQYVYLTAERGITENGVTGDTRLYIGQYQAIEDTAGIPPVVSIIAPATGSTLIEGRAVTIEASATDDIGVAGVTFLVNGQPAFTDTAAPFQYAFTVPLGVTTLSLGAQAIDFGSNIGLAPVVNVNVIPNPPPTINITSPDDTVLEGETIIVAADAADDSAIGSVVFTINGAPQPPDTIAPYSMSFTAPAGIELLTVLATATDNQGKQASDATTVSVIPDPGTTVIGRVTDETGNGASGVTVRTVGSRFSVTETDGTFEIGDVPTVLGNIRVTAHALIADNVLFGSSSAFAPVRGGQTDVGTLVLRPAAFSGNIVWVSHNGPLGFSGPIAGFGDDAFVTLLQAAGHNVIRFCPPNSAAIALTDADLDALNTNDLIIVGRSINSPPFQQPGVQGPQWNTHITKPILMMSPYPVQTDLGRLGWFQGSSLPDTAPPTLLEAVNLNDPETAHIFQDVAMNGNLTAESFDEAIDRNTSTIVEAPVPGGTTLARAIFVPRGGGTQVIAQIIAEFPAGTMVRGGADILAGYRMFFAGGTREASGAAVSTAGKENLTSNTGERLFLRAVQVALNNGLATEDPGTTVIGRVVDTNGTAVAGATVTVFGRFNTLTDSTGNFVIQNAPTIFGSIVAKATFNSGGKTQFASSAPVPGIRGEITDVGTLVLLTQIRLLIVFSDDFPPVNELLATALFEKVDLFNSGAGTPSLNVLSGYHAVLHYSNFQPLNGIGLGDVLADYVDQGGKLMLTTYSFSNPWSVAGRIMQSNYSPLANVGINGDVSGFLVPTVADRMFADININAVSYFHNPNFSHPNLSAGAVLLATDGSGHIMIARNQQGNIIGFNFFPRGGNFGGNNQEFYKLVSQAIISLF